MWTCWLVLSSILGLLLGTLLGMVVVDASPPPKTDPASGGKHHHFMHVPNAELVLAQVVGVPSILRYARIY
jgi:hypothetical protein